MDLTENNNEQQDLTYHGLLSAEFALHDFFLNAHVPIICGTISLIADYVLFPEINCSGQFEGNAVGATVSRWLPSCAHHSLVFLHCANHL